MILALLACASIVSNQSPALIPRYRLTEIMPPAAAANLTISDKASGNCAFAVANGFHGRPNLRSYFLYRSGKGLQRVFDTENGIRVKCLGISPNGNLLLENHYPDSPGISGPKMIGVFTGEIDQIRPIDLGFDVTWSEGDINDRGAVVIHAKGKSNLVKFIQTEARVNIETPTPQLDFPGDPSYKLIGEDGRAVSVHRTGLIYFSAAGREELPLEGIPKWPQVMAVARSSTGLVAIRGNMERRRFGIFSPGTVELPRGAYMLPDLPENNGVPTLLSINKSGNAIISDRVFSRDVHYITSGSRVIPFSDLIHRSSGRWEDLRPTTLLDDGTVLGMGRKMGEGADVPFAAVPVKD